VCGSGFSSSAAGFAVLACLGMPAAAKAAPLTTGWVRTPLWSSLTQVCLPPAKLSVRHPLFTPTRLSLPCWAGTCAQLCPENYFCRPFSIYPRQCPISSNCPAGSEVPLLSFGGIAIAMVMLSLLMPVLLYVQYRKNRTWSRNNLRLARLLQRQENCSVFVEDVLCIKQIEKVRPLSSRLLLVWVRDTLTAPRDMVCWW
jgi:hypothetical protein